MKKIADILIILSFCTVCSATHNRAGQIIYKHISGYTYEFTVTTFTYTLSAADRPELDISWGDNKVSTMARSNVEVLPDYYQKNTYIIRHTYPGAGVYTIIVQDPNRNVGVQNIPQSDNVIFSVKTIFRIDPNLAANNAPELLAYPIDRAALGRVFIHNPSAYDIDGDSLSYEIAVCTRGNGIEIENYSFPEASDSLVVNPVTGDLIWASPTKVGIYNIAMKINEWRRGVRIGSIARDMQVEVVDSDNRPPDLPDLPPRCVEAGTKITRNIRATDRDNDIMVLTATGGPFKVNVSPAKIDSVRSVAGIIEYDFNWQTDPGHVRKQPYTVNFKVEDQNSDVKLVSFAHFNITVLAPKIKNFTATAEKKTIRLAWDKTECPHAAGYEIYRSIGSNEAKPDSCSGGIPTGSGYEKIAAIKDISTLTYDDDNNGKGLSPGINYCYRIIAYFADGAKGFPSDETCAVLLAGTPPMIQCDVATVDKNNGVVNVAWLYEPVKDILAGKTGPFEYRLYWSLDMNSGNWNLLKQTSDMEDTVYVHNNIDTRDTYPYFYKVELWDLEPGKESLIDDYETASTLYPVLQPSDKSAIITFGRYAPWVNTEYTVYRCLKTGNDVCDPVDVAGVTTEETFTDTGLKNGQEYCYRIVSKGYRTIDGATYENTNRSHIACVVPYDNVPPCVPELEGKSLCEEDRNQLNWSYDYACMDDVEKYCIYYSSDRSRYEKIDSVMNRDVQTYLHNNVVVGCYYITAVDSVGNKSQGSNVICLDECGDYELPNVFTPNGDNINDVFKSYNPGNVFTVEMKIFNRRGKLVFKTTDPDINWDGRDIDSKRFVPSGVYYYLCDVYEERLTGPQIKSLSGFIHVYYGDGAVPFIPSLD
jgi:gliding motility-associated-like protein